MRGNKATYADDDYEAGGDAEDKQAGGDKPLSSKYRGVCWNRKNKRWQAAINSGGKYVYLGSFVSENEAARAFDKAAVKLRGTRAKLNFAYSEYVDENGNLLEDPKMKSVMYKIEAIQGAGGGGGGHHNRHNEQGGGDDHHNYPHLNQNLQAVAQDAVVHGLTAGASPAPGPHRPQLPALMQHTGKVVPQQGCSDGRDGLAGSGPWQQPQPQRGGGLQQPYLQLAAPGAQQQQQQHGPDAPLFAQFPGGPAGPSQLAVTLPPGASPGPGKAGPLPVQPPATRPRAASSLGQSTALLSQPYGPMGGGGVPAGPGGVANGYDSPAALAAQALTMAEQPPGFGASPSSAAAAGALARPAAPSPAVKAAILRELPPGVQVLMFMPNRLTNSKEVWGVLYTDSAWPQQTGVIVWTGASPGSSGSTHPAAASNHINMGLYDTERDAKQAAIKCMQLYCAFCSDEWRVDFFNALTTMGEQQQQQQQQQHASAQTAGESPVARGGGRASNTQADPHAHSASATHNQNSPHHTQQQQQQRPDGPYMRTSPNGSRMPYGGGGGCTDANGGAGRMGMSEGYAQEAAAGQGGLQQLQRQQQQAPAPSSSHVGLGELFEYVAALGRRSGKGSSREGGAEVGSESGGALGKRGAPDDFSQRQEQQPETKRLRLEAGRNGEVVLDLMVGGSGPGSEFRAAHNLPLAAIAKQLQQTAAAGR